MGKGLLNKSNLKDGKRTQEAFKKNQNPQIMDVG